MNEFTDTPASPDFYDDVTKYNFMMSEGTTLAKFIKRSIEVLLPYMDGPGSDHFII